MHLPCVEPPAEEPAEAPAPHDEPPALLPPVPAILQPCSGVARRAGPCMLAAHHIRGGHGLGSCCALASSHGRDGLSGGPATPDMGLGGPACACQRHTREMGVYTQDRSIPPAGQVECFKARLVAKGFKQRTASTTTRSSRPCHSVPPSVPCLLWPQTRIWR
jgi:hypothetical protein